MEALTNEIAHRAWEHIQEIEKLGGMAKAIEKAFALRCVSRRLRPRTQARIDSGRQTIVGINKYRLDHEDPIDILEIDNTEVRKDQVARLVDLRGAPRRSRSRQEGPSRPSPNAVRTKRATPRPCSQGSRRARNLGEISVMPAKKS